MRMGRVLGARGGRAGAAASRRCVLAVYLTRDEDNIQADNLLAENFTKAVALGDPDEHDGTRRPAPRSRAFDWDRVLLVAAGHARARAISRAARAASGPAIDTVDGGDLLIFLAGRRGRALRRLPRAPGTFAGFERPFDGARRATRAVFAVRSMIRA